LPPSLRDWLPEDYLAYFPADLVEEPQTSSLGLATLHGHLPLDDPAAERHLVNSICQALMGGHPIAI